MSRVKISDNSVTCQGYGINKHMHTANDNLFYLLSQPALVSQVKAEIIKHLPVLVFGREAAQKLTGGESIQYNI